MNPTKKSPPSRRRTRPAAAPQPDLGRPHNTRADRLDPEAATLLSMLNLADRGALSDKSLARHRLAWRLSALALGRADAVAQVETLTVPGPDAPLELRLYRPSASAEPAPAFLWFHGGGFLMGGIATADTLCRHIAKASGAIVVAARYRLAPEHDLYAGRADCLAALDWLVNEGHTVGIDATRIAIGGDSAGGNLAAAVAQRHTARGGPALRMQVLAYPATNLHDEFASMSENARGYMLTTERIDAILSLITREPADLTDPWISPAFSPALDGLPPALILTAGYDPIRDDGLAYVGKLRDAGVPVELLHYAGQFHGFLNFDGVLRTARDALDRIGAALRRALADTPTAAVDRTVEIAACTRESVAFPTLRLGREMLIAGLMVGERLESWRAAMMRRVLPGSGWAAALAGSLLLNPVTAYRAEIGQRYAAIGARETYRGGLDGRPYPG
ncbi:alpha/beta hydrolase [Burkholderia guangdongensis]|uniref:alpha/beta hydrolase n=1 Tax=Burkholderia guangdongensis TaxID=1792500 RepID=UPI0015C77CC4|nr:alpha/beta hydrolase [Burkholderia guangdongensis]